MSAALYIAACTAIFYCGFCRLVHTDLTTVLCIRIVMWMLTVSAACAVAAVLVWDYVPGWPSAVLAAAMAAVQVASSVLWRDGVPAEYRLGEARSLFD